MRVLVVLTPALDPTTGGVQMSTVKMSRMFHSKGFDVGVFSFASSGHVKISGVELFAAPAEGNVSNKRNLEALTGCLNRFQPDVVINQMPYEHAITDVVRATSSAILIGCLRNTLYSVRNNLVSYGEKLLPRPLVPLARNPIGQAALLWFHRRRHAEDLRRILKRYDRFVMFAEPNLDELRYFVPDYPREKVSLIPNSIESVATEVPEKENSILWLSRVSRAQKRADLILPLWRQLESKLQDWTFDVVGDGPMLEDIRSEAAAEGLPRIKFHGRQPSMPYFEKAKIYVMTSDFEGFPNTVIEAQSRGAIPVIRDTYPMASAIIKDGYSGKLIGTASVGDLAKVINKLANEDLALVGKMASNCLASAEKYTFQCVADRWSDLLNTLLGTTLVNRRAKE